MVNAEWIANEVALEQALYATEVVSGEAEPPSGRLLGDWSSKPGRGLIKRSEDATGRYDRTTRATRRTVVDPSGNYTEDLTYESWPAHLAIGVQGGVSPVSDGEPVPGYLRRYIPAGRVDDIDTITVHHGVNGLAWESVGVRWSEWNISGDATSGEGVIQFSGTPFIRDVHPLPGWFRGVATGGTLGTNAVQTLTVTGTPTGGTYTLTYRGQTTAPIAFNAIASAIDAALEALPRIGAGNVTCAGGPLPGTPVTITFTGDLAATKVALITANGGGLTGGSSPTAAVANTTPGSGEGTLIMASAGWDTDEWEGSMVFIDAGSHMGPVREIQSNDGTTLQLSGPRLDVAPGTGVEFYIAPFFPLVDDPGHEAITMEGLEVYLDHYDENSSNLGETLISDRVVSFNVSQTLNIARKRRASGIIRRVGRGAREITGVIRLELDRPDETDMWLSGDHGSLRIQKKGSIIDPDAETTKLFGIDLECIEIDDFTPDADNNNRTASFAFVALIPDNEDIAVFDSITTLPALP